MHLLGSIGLVVKVNGHLLAFFQAQQRPWKLAVVEGRGENAIGSKFDRFDRDGKGIIRRNAGLRFGALRMRQSRMAKGSNPRKQGTSRHGARGLQEFSTRVERIWHRALVQIK